MCEADRIFKLIDLAGYRRIKVGKLERYNHGVRVYGFHVNAAYEWHFAVDRFRDVPLSH